MFRLSSAVYARRHSWDKPKSEEQEAGGLTTPDCCHHRVGQRQNTGTGKFPCSGREEYMNPFGFTHVRPLAPIIGLNEQPANVLGAHVPQEVGAFPMEIADANQSVSRGCTAPEGSHLTTTTYRLRRVTPETTNLTGLNPLMGKCIRRRIYRIDRE